ncbi:hypothetical protein HDV00_008112 [Rhizophlyctis rosea]|nr:hypothetical protein HDV00_008112 [Rhizophlyctis rosea]
MAASASSSILNIHSANLLRLGALGTGIFWGATKFASLTRFVKEREELRHQQLEDDLIEEGKIAFEAKFNREQAILARRDGVASIDSENYKFDGERYINWLINHTEGQQADNTSVAGGGAKEAEKKLGKK